MGKRYKTEEIFIRLIEIQLSINKDKYIVQAYQKTGVSDYSFYRWRKEYDDIKIDQPKKHTGLER